MDTDTNELIPKELLETIPNLYETERTLNPICHVKLFTPFSQWTWYIIEISKDDLDTCYGYVQGLDSELGYFSLKELASIKGVFGLGVERDICFLAIPLSRVKEK
ncbi:hypothetical protein CP965_00845 [Halarcobacter mediterraneus]|uniref:DUF2958 domain-containing protein n=1 Tax=Halarcobacter mediterraneus TaxID=2023153 RepID=A0A4Q1AWD3_9BACT|nr:DUF2958 domain-containing protein [Halarcobacter mediterraneus]RXK14028.1 hypothetical protein CP965_00845 [Halarcobacter mediterraneus]